MAGHGLALLLHHVKSLRHYVHDRSLSETAGLLPSALSISAASRIVSPFCTFPPRFHILNAHPNAFKLTHYSLPFARVHLTIRPFIFSALHLIHSIKQHQHTVQAFSCSRPSYYNQHRVSPCKNMFVYFRSAGPAVSSRSYKYIKFDETVHVEKT